MFFQYFQSLLTFPSPVKPSRSNIMFNLSMICVRWESHQEHNGCLYFNINSKILLWVTGQCLSSSQYSNFEDIRKVETINSGSLRSLRENWETGAEIWWSIQDCIYCYTTNLKGEKRTPTKSRLCDSMNRMSKIRIM